MPTPPTAQLPTDLTTLVMGMSMGDLCSLLARSGPAEAAGILRILRAKGLPIPTPVFSYSEAASSPSAAPVPYWRQCLRAGQCFGFTWATPANAAQNGFIRLRNPTGSGVRLLVRIVVPQGTAGLFQLNATTAGQAQTGEVDQAAVRNLLLTSLGGIPGSSLGIISLGTTNGALQGYQFFASSQSTKGIPFNAVFDDFFVEIPENCSMICWDQTQNEAVTWSLAWAEVPKT